MFFKFNNLILHLTDKQLQLLSKLLYLNFKLERLKLYFGFYEN